MQRDVIDVQRHAQPIRDSHERRDGLATDPQHAQCSERGRLGFARPRERVGEKLEVGSRALLSDDALMREALVGEFERLDAQQPR
jgi:hypothetical protein